MCSSNVAWSEIDGNVHLDTVFRNLALLGKDSSPTSSTWMQDTLNWWDK